MQKNIELSDQLIELSSRMNEVKAKEKIKKIVCFSEIRLTKKQIDIMNKPFFGFDKGEEVFYYYKGKIHGNILLKKSKWTTREDQPDIQYLIDLGVKALENGMSL